MYDATPVVAFNSAGQGIVAWTRNASASPLKDAAGNEVMIATWDPATHSWSAPMALTSDLVADRQPAVYTGEDGTFTVAWIRDAAVADSVLNSNEAWYRRFENGSWTAAAPLPMLGMPASGRISQIAIGSSGMENGRERIDVLLAHTQNLASDPQHPNGQVVSNLYHRSAWTDDFAAQAGVQTAAENTNFSYLRTLKHPDGGMLAYWQQGDGRTNEIFAAHLAGPGPGGSTWGRPTQLTFGEDLEVAPVLAVDSTGGDTSFQVMFHQKPMPGETMVHPQDNGVPMKGGVGGITAPVLPELGFTRELNFVAQDRAPVAPKRTPRPRSSIAAWSVRT